MNPTPTISEAARRAARKYADQVAPLGSDANDWVRIIEQLTPIIKEALDSAHPAPEGHDWPNAHGRVVDAAGNAITSDPTLSAPSPQSVAEGAATELHEVFALEGFSEYTTRAILTRHFAPVYAALTERDERLGRLEEAREDALQALGEHPESETDLAQRIREIRQEGRDLFHDLTALRTRCEELERDNNKLREMCALAHAGAKLYADDGELQDTTAVPFIDWKRDTIAEIREKIYTRNVAALKRAARKEGQP